MDFYVVAVPVDEPAKGTNGEDREARGEEPEPDMTITPTRRFRLFRETLAGPFFPALLPL